MSCAPFLISLSSSGKRYDSVSRESSVHSMMSMNCFLMKSRIAMLRSSCPCGWLPCAVLLLGRRQLLGLVVGALELGFDPLRGDSTRHDRTVREDQRGRRVH